MSDILDKVGGMMVGGLAKAAERAIEDIQKTAAGVGVEVIRHVQGEVAKQVGHIVSGLDGISTGAPAKKAPKALRAAPKCSCKPVTVSVEGSDGVEENVTVHARTCALR